MILKIIFASVMTLVVTLGEYTPSSNSYLFGFAKQFHLFNQLNFFDGPSSISNAPTTSASMTPTLEQMMYYNYYAASMYCPYELILTNDVADTVAVVAVSNSRQEIVIAYRGTMNIANVVLDLILYNGHNPSGPHCIKVHRGFHGAAMSLYNDVVKNVACELMQHPGFKIVITGHSLGGAMARVTQYYLITMNQFPEAIYEVYTYGEPRVGNKCFADFINRLNVTTARVVARADIVPHVPPVSIFGTKVLGDYYVHPQTEFWIDGKDGQRFCDRSQYEDPTCSSSLGPLYTPIDHIKYFDTNIGTCFVRQPLPIFTLPVVFQPVGLIPPLPEFISNFLEGAASLG